ncbi:MAG: hypothetical protein OQK35_03975 [Alphaproteobacteria bacterium]|nr:hypothetical protein [Rhodospirillales bacterium]MCW9045471.1 hypothetical protein [Alphaproteobacteria bacterium]
MKVFTLVVIPFLVVLGGCVTQPQNNIDILNTNWGNENRKIISELGTRYYKLSKKKAHSAMLIALSNLGLIIEQQDSDSGFIIAKGNSPSPLSDDEWKRVAELETPYMKSVLGPTAHFKSGTSDAIFNSITMGRKDDVQMNLRYRTKFTGTTYGLVVGTQGPPEYLRISIRKIWNEFEKTAFIQGKVLRSTHD